MQHPKSKDVRKVVELLTSVLPMATREDHLNMMKGSVCVDYTCGTVCCHGGWFAIAKSLHRGRYVDYWGGANAMAESIGLGDGNQLEKWANYSSKIWGNESGSSMFFDELAFFHPTKRPEGAQTLQHIIDHWSEVADRLEALENQVEISEPPITATELIQSLENKNQHVNAD
jgi:hypothetical protein